MIEEKCEFYNDGQKLVGSFYLPDQKAEAGKPKPVVIACSGFMGLNNIHPARYARALTKRGYTCFGFDYLGFGPSGGKQGRILLDAEVQDMACAISYVAGDARAKGAPIVMLGWGMGGGQILQVGHLPEVKGLVAINGFYNGRRVQEALRGPEGFTKFVAWVEEQRKIAVRSADGIRLEPFDMYPLDKVTVGYVDGTLRKNPGFTGRFDISLADSLMRFAPEGNLAPLKDKPILIAHGDQNALHPVGEAESLHSLYPGPKELYWIKGGGHTEWMFDDNPLFVALAGKIVSWLEALE